MEILTKKNEILTMDKGDLKKTGALAFEQDMIKVDEGLTTATSLMLTARKAVEILNGYIFTAKDACKNEVFLEGGTISQYGSIMTVANTGDRLDFESNLEYKRLKNELKSLEGLIKIASKSGNSIYDANGVEVEPVKVKTFGGEVLKVTL